MLVTTEPFLQPRGVISRVKALMRAWGIVTLWDFKLFSSVNVTQALLSPGYQEVGRFCLQVVAVQRRET